MKPIRLATSFHNLYRDHDYYGTPLTEDHLFRFAPSVFSESPHQSRSDRYTYIPTIDVIRKLGEHGFQPFYAVQGRCRKPDKTLFTKHLIRFRHTDKIGRSEAPEILLINSHDGTSAYQFLSGIIRYVCLNRSIDGSDLAEVKVQHRGDVLERVVEGVYTALERFGETERTMLEWRDTRIGGGIERAYASGAAEIAFGHLKSTTIEPEEILKVRRAVDSNPDLWTLFNRVQENIVRGGLEGLHTDREGNVRRMRTRGISSIDRDISVNRALWKFTQEVQSLIA